MNNQQEVNRLLRIIQDQQEIIKQQADQNIGLIRQLRLIRNAEYNE